MPVRGFLLVGGRSSRMGQDKALLTYQGQPLALHLSLILRAAGLTNISLIGAKSAHSQLGLPCLPDPPDLPLHPLRGVVAALEHLRSDETALLCPVDLAGLTPEHVHSLLLCPPPTCCTAEDQLQPLLCHVGPAHAPLARQLCASGGSVRSWSATFFRLELPSGALQNLNTPADLLAAAARAAEGQGVD
jgi:molybdopterin-guanine dinucleotide biosynthesis protein A